MDELERKIELLEMHKRRKHEFDKKIALYGHAVEPHITIEQQDIAKIIQELEREIAKLRQGVDPYKKIHDLTKTIQELTTEIAKLRQVPEHLSPFVDPYNAALIIDAAKIIDFPLQQIESFFGQPVEVLWRKIGSAEDIPDGGETREYTFRKYTIWINYNKSKVATGIRLFEGLEEEHYALDDWMVILERVGLLSIMRIPDITGLTTRTWLNHLGYRITVAAQRVNGPVTAVRVYKLPK